MNGHPDAFALVGQTLASIIDPPEPEPFSQWLPKNLVLVDGPRAGETWSADGAPYLAEIADCLNEDHPSNLVTVRKSQQTGASILGLGWCLYIADREPANTLYGAPGIDALRDMNSGKLQPLIEAWQKRMRRVVFEPQTSRSGTGSTTYEKVFPGGRLYLANANSITDLSSKTIKKGIKDEVSKWEDIPGYGDPETAFFGRFTAFRREKSYKILEISTPEIDTGDELGEAPGHCRIDRSFRRSDQRFWNCVCPECGNLFVHQFARLRIDAEHPHRTRYECLCGHHVSEAERVLAVRDGRWIASEEGPDRHPGFHIDSFVSLMMSYEAIAEDHLNARTESEKKLFANLVLGLPHKFAGDAPDHVRLMERREDGLMRGHVPPRGLILVASADVQMRGIWLLIKAYAPNRESWTVDAMYLDGDTSTPGGEAFEKLRKETLERSFPDAFGRQRRLDALGIDAGYRSNIVYAWVRQNQRLHPDTGRDLILALDGKSGWGHPAIGTPRPVDIDLDGRKIKQGCKIWPVGTWPLKSDFYSDLRQRGVRSGEERDPDGYCHFGMWLDENYFLQITAEAIEDVVVRGRVAGRRWAKVRDDNHFLDDEIYARALAEYLGMSSMSADEWAALAVSRGLPAELAEADLFTPAHLRDRVAAATSSEIAPPEVPSDTETTDTWVAPRSDWLMR